ncbi:class I SAM-dependent methyltransferase [Psychromonas ossibalaenae]|uniref:class I SAM-dependent methyltransferase n=1 Tax=Psychromonas ossibalaenae TaxID=444922 RepID=UPI00036C6894|nr:class I SAM-dependent methyltransferase [Psychromonas ossibalaenae]
MKRIIKKLLRKIINTVQNFKEKNSHKKFLQENIHLLDADGIQTHLTSQEKRVLYKLSRGFAKKCIAVEIGSYVGASSCFIAGGFTHDDSALYCIDTWNNDAMTEGNIDTFHKFKYNCKYFLRKIKMVRGLSYEVVNKVRLLAGGNIDLLFIDGDHTYDGVKADWDSYSPMLQKGSVVVFHDIGWAEGVRKVIDEDVIGNVSSFESLPNLWWGSIK